LKESFVKATGQGITKGLSSFRFELKTTAAKKYHDDINLYTDNNNKVDNNWLMIKNLALAIKPVILTEYQ
jgi:phosphopantetheinyl transferase